MKRIFTVFSAMLLLTSCSAKETSKETAPAPKAEVTNGVYADITTNRGKITVKLEAEKTPLTVCNFVGLAEGTIKNTAKPEGTPYYNGIIFHRVIKGFMIQGGDPTGTGRGGPGYQFEDEIDTTLKHYRAGTLSMANAGAGTNGSQFFITHAATPHLDGRHTVFGYVTDGMDVVETIATTPTAAGDRPVQEIRIENIQIRRVGEDAEKFTGNQAMFDSLKVAIKEEKEAALKAAHQKTIDELKSKYENVVESENGFYYVVTAQGEGESPAQGANISAHYSGKLLSGKEFDSSYRRGQPFSFPLGTGRVIKGWDLAFAEMKKGEKRTLFLPPELAYGERGAGGIIPPNAWLIFDVELVDF